nr:hypothetical protein [Tanacetum cinerariifolium]
TCKTLVELNLEGEYELDVPKDEVHFPSMKKICLVVYFECKVTIDVPNLVYLYIMDEVQSDYSFMVKPLFLVEAYIHSITIYGDQILTNISAAKVLTLTSSASLLELMLSKRSRKKTKCVNAANEELTTAKHKLMILKLKLFKNIAATDVK